MPVIEFTNVSKTFSRVGGRALLRSHLNRILHPVQRERFFALHDVSFTLAPGESLAVVGPNGAGKSTLLSLVAGLAKPDSGTVQVRGRIAALLELGSGFHPDLTGAENVRLNAALLGLTRQEITQRFEEIVDFSGVSEFIDEPMRTYSNGMVLRLAFSVAINIDPEVLLIDEVLSVGDQAFQIKCAEKLHDLRRHGKTLLCVSHAAGIVQQLCDRAIWLDHGELLMTGDVRRVTEAYAGRQVAANI